jgi:hypothetical protein
MKECHTTETTEAPSASTATHAAARQRWKTRPSPSLWWVVLLSEQKSSAARGESACSCYPVAAAPSDLDTHIAPLSTNHHRTFYSCLLHVPFGFHCGSSARRPSWRSP